LFLSVNGVEMEMLATKTAEMGMAVGQLKQLSADEATRLRYEARELYLMDEMARNEAAFAEGEAKGRKEGREEGRDYRCPECVADGDGNWRHLTPCRFFRTRDPAPFCIETGIRTR
jgi:hypothetical protein